MIKNVNDTFIDFKQDLNNPSDIIYSKTDTREAKFNDS